MRNFSNIFTTIVMWIVLATMVCVIYDFMAQPMVFAAEKKEILKPGYMPERSEAPQIDSKRFSSHEGYIYNPETGTTSRVELRSYRVGKETIYTGRITVEPDIREMLRKED